MHFPRFIPTITVKSFHESDLIKKIILGSSINCVEATLRDGFSVDGINSLADTDGLNVGLGTVYHPDQLAEINLEKIKFIVSPGFSLELYEFTQREEILYIPGIETSSEIIRAVNNNLMILKFFPAEPSGGIEKLKAYQPVFDQVKFICTGGINLKNYSDYLKQDNVCALAGSFVLPRDFIENDLINDAIIHLNNL
ncbi:MAG TPA: hypothetical protein EYO80_04640 [Candidatus Marinimicrobia bacterium]|jgi:2-dehydro-3-deoxyphosphogluconate aldolase/(4S)-4-hydroxy-2-oxoglutarate aldolase|nr:hypothetical protein [Candidatus Neomarinimicrobiota bacterium]